MELVEVEALRLKFQVGPSAEVGDALEGEVGVAEPWHAMRVLGGIVYGTHCTCLPTNLLTGQLAAISRHVRAVAHVAVNVVLALTRARASVCV